MATTWPHYFGMDFTSQIMAFGGVSSTTSGTLALSSAYVYGSSGAAACLLIFIAPETANLTDIWFKVTAHGGTWASTDGLINWYVREGFNGSRIPGTSLTGSGTYTHNGTTGWKNITGLSVALTAGKVYSVIIADADGGATNNVTIATRYGTTLYSNLVANECGTASTGFASAYSPLTTAGACMVKVGSLTFGGQIWDTATNVSNSTFERGNRFRPKEDCTFLGWCAAVDSLIMFANGHVLKVYADGVNPGGTPLLSVTTPATTLGGASNPSIPCCIIPAASRIDLSANTWYRCVIDPQTNITVPKKITAGGSPDATLLAAAIPFGGDYYTTEESGGAWSDTTSSFYNLGPILVPKTAASGGSAPMSPMLIDGPHGDMAI